jgi:hypothetical protein
MSAPPGGQMSGPPRGQMSGPMAPPAWRGAAAPGPGGPAPGGTYPAGGRTGPKRNRGVLVAIALVVVLVLGGGGYALSKVLGDGDGDNGGGDNNGQNNSATPATVDVTHPDTDWSSSAEQYEGNAGKTIAYECPADGTIGTVWGSEPYTTDSSVCTAAVHAGRISLADGGRVIIEIRQGEESYGGTTQNSIVTTEYGPYPWCFTFVG